jgi:phosphoglycolate phosphatase-like HAD superfamily hydrolase
MAPKKLLLFDIDGTLLDPAGEGRGYFKHALTAAFGKAGPVDTFDMAGKTDWQIVDELMGLAGVDRAQIAAKREAVFEVYARQVAEHAPTFNMRVLPGVLPLLSRLRRIPEFDLGLVTGNVREAVPHKLRAVGIDPDQFLVGAFGSEHVDRNILPGLAFERWAEALGEPVQKEQVLIIGDTPRDIACARHAGMKVFCVATGRHGYRGLAAHQPDYLLEDFTQTEEVLQILRTF